MGKNSKIEWTHHTFNPWWGCVKVSAACKHCYAETWARRVGEDVWGKRAPRRFFTDKHWRTPLVWDREAEAEGRRRRVFCASMADVFEERRDLDPHRERLWALIADTPNLDWLLLTKRPDAVSSLVPWDNAWPANVWLGTTAETQAWADKRIPHLAETGARVKFLSCEPLLGALDLTPYLGSIVSWVIAGGESGGKARPSKPEWFRDIRDHCAAAGVPFHFKQWGNWVPVQEGEEQERIVRMSKRAAGRLLDGATHDGVPA